ncbi:YchJ family protein [Humidisolicoccus flavus]|uniref:YchJ family protein n=1 Tax=Humidisolicoccus flavus TaxID=3111414 RepID=UPI00324766CB
MSFGHGAARNNFPRFAANDRCPCGSGQEFGQCCEPLLDGQPAPTAERLMRSRYSAFVTGNAEYLSTTWFAATRPERLQLDPKVQWLGLEVIASTESGDSATVEFKARSRRGRAVDEQHERSVFTRRAGRWLYVDGEL